jgi:hypothetical protein
MNRLQQRKLTRQEPNSNPNSRLLCNARTGSLLANPAILARLRKSRIGERDIWEGNIRERDIRERNILEKDIRETIATCRFAEWLLLHIDIGGVSGYLSFSQSWRCWARFLRHHKLQILQPTKGVSLRSSWS